VVSYIQVVEEIVSLKALLGTSDNKSCEDYVDFEFGKEIPRLDKMREELEKFEKLVIDHRNTETSLKDHTEERFAAEPVYCPPEYYPPSMKPRNALPPSISPPTYSNDAGTRSAPPSPQVGEIDLPPSSTPANYLLQLTQNEESSNALDGDVSIQYDCRPTLYKLLFNFKRVNEGSQDSPLLQVPSHDTPIYNRVFQLRLDEVKWTFKNFGKYSIDVLYDAIDNCKGNIVGTCEKLKSNETYRNEFVEFGKQGTLHYFDDEWNDCS